VKRCEKEAVIERSEKRCKNTVGRRRCKEEEELRGEGIRT
jgi:hypothetical protein